MEANLLSIKKPCSPKVSANQNVKNYFGAVNLGLRAEDTTPASSIMPLYCTILNADSK